MHIVICNTLYPPLGIGGAERSVQFLAEALAKRGHEVTVLSQGISWRRVEEQSGGVRIIRIGSPPGFKPNIYAHRSLSTRLAARFFRRWEPEWGRVYLREIEWLSPDVVHTNSVKALEQIWTGARGRGLPVVHTLRNHASLCPGRMFAEGKACEGQCAGCRHATTRRRAAGERLSAIVGISDYILQEHLTNRYFSAVDSRSVIPNSYASENLSWRPRGEGEPIRLGFLGRLHETKGIVPLIEVMRQFEGCAELAVAGTGNPSFVADLRSRAGKNVKFLDFVPADRLLTKLDALVVPSLWREPFGRIYAEALVHGVPVVGSIHGAGRELVREGQTGWLCDPSDERELSRAVGRAIDELSRPNELRANCLTEGRRFAPDVVAAAYERVYEAAIESERAQRTSCFLQGELKG